MAEGPFNRIIRMLHARGFSVRKLAKLLGLSQTAVSNALRGKSRNPVVLYEVSKILGVPRYELQRWIFGREEGDLTVRSYKERTKGIPEWLAGEALLRFLPDSSRVDEVAFLHAERAARRCMHLVLSHYPSDVPQEPILREFQFVAEDAQGRLVWTDKARVLFNEAGGNKGTGSERKEDS